MTETNENKESCENLCNLVVRKRKMLKDERGQLSIDFLVGISLFILALVFMAHFIPGMFVPFQTETIDLNSVAYRTSVILVEDPGWWDNEPGADYGTDWDTEGHIDNVRRVGLAIDKEHPNVLSKIEGFKNCNCTILTDKLGLYRNIGGKKIDYGYNITIVDANNNIRAAKGEIPPEYGDVVKMKRIVSVRDSERGAIDASDMSGASSPVKALLVIDSANVSTFCNDAIHPLKMSITNFTLEGAAPGFMHVKIVQTNLSNEPGINLHGPDKYGVGTGLGIKMGSGQKLDDLSDGWRQVEYAYDGSLSSKEDLGVSVDINSADDTLTILINKSAFMDAAPPITTSGDDPGDIVIQINLQKIECAPAYTTDEILEYSETKAIVQIPVTLIIKVWT